MLSSLLFRGRITYPHFWWLVLNTIQKNFDNTHFQPLEAQVLIEKLLLLFEANVLMKKWVMISSYFIFITLAYSFLNKFSSKDDDWSAGRWLKLFFLNCAIGLTLFVSHLSLVSKEFAFTTDKEDSCWTSRRSRSF